MSDFKEVSLGFAEFVSQLIQETFDAILSSQNYQLEKFAELQNKLNLSNKAFKESFITDEEVELKIVELFGGKIKKQMVVDESFITLLMEVFETNEKIVYKKRLTNLGYDSIHDYASNLLVEERKETLNSLINNSNISNIVVDSGEITAKLELTNLFTQETDKEISKPIDPPTKLSLRKIDKTKKPIKKIVLPTFQRKIDVINFKDSKSGKTTVLIDKKSIKNINESNFQIPNVRLSVQPTKLTETSNLYSEIKINFKTL